MDSLSLFRAHGDRWGTAHVMLGLGQLALHRGDLDAAERYWEERQHLSREIDNQDEFGEWYAMFSSISLVADSSSPLRRKTSKRLFAHTSDRAYRRTGATTQPAQANGRDSQSA